MRRRTFADVFQPGMGLESPQFEINYNVDPRGGNASSSASINFKVCYEPYEFSNPTPEDMRNVKFLAYQILEDTGHMYLPLFDDDEESSLKLQSVSVKPVEGTNIWDVECQYSDAGMHNDEAMELNLKNFQFSTQGHESHISRSLDTVGSVDIWGGEGYNFFGNIGWDDGEIAGVDVKRPHLVFSRDVWILSVNMDFVIMRNLAEFTGSVNADMFYGFYPGTVLFTGVSQGQRASLKWGDKNSLYWQITLAFEVSPNAYVPFGGKYIYKRGWDYLWYLNHKVVVTPDETSPDEPENPENPPEGGDPPSPDDPPPEGGDPENPETNPVYTAEAKKVIVRVPVQATVEQVYPYREFCKFFGFGHSSSMTNGENFFNG